MKQFFISSMVFIQLLALMGCSVKTSSQKSDIPQDKDRLKRLDGTSVSTAELEAFIEEEVGLADLSLYAKVGGEVDQRGMPESVFSVGAESEPEGEIKEGI